PRRLVLCGRTREYRRAAAELPLKLGSRVLEVGCHEGLTTALLSERFGPAHVLGVDRSAAAVSAARTRFPGLSFDVLDVNMPGGIQSRLQALSLLCRGPGPETEDNGFRACFLDLGGDAKLSAVLQAVAELRQLPGLELLVVKSEALLRLRRDSALVASSFSTAPSTKSQTRPMLREQLLVRTQIRWSAAHEVVE
ncbi:unnamed protein product, partial [Polarella glacialis]